MVDVVVVGAGGFGREVLDTIEAMAGAGEAVTVLGVVDDAPSPINLERLEERGIAYLDTIDAWLAGVEQSGTSPRFVLGVGNPAVRRTLCERIEGAGLEPFTVIHPSAILGSRTKPADGLVICAGVVVSTNVRFGRHVHLNPNATIGHDATLGNYVSVNPNATVSGEVLIHDEVLVGASATILQNLEVGESATVGAGAVVTKPVTAAATVTGVPAT